MSCICQFVRVSSLTNHINVRVSVATSTATTAVAETATSGSAAAAAPRPHMVEASQEAVSDDAKIAVCVSELSNYRAENWLLKKKLHDCEVTIENLEQLMSTIVSKQHQVLRELNNLRKRNSELETQCNLQREHHATERNALIKEVHELKNLSKEPQEENSEGDLDRSCDQLSGTESDNDCSYNPDSDEENQSIISSIASHTSYSSDEQLEHTESEDETRESIDVEFSTATDTESD